MALAEDIKPDAHDIARPPATLVRRPNDLVLVLPDIVRAVHPIPPAAGHIPPLGAGILPGRANHPPGPLVFRLGGVESRAASRKNNFILYLPTTRAQYSIRMVTEKKLPFLWIQPLIAKKTRS